MARPQVFTSDTTLYHPVEGPRVFPTGETDPGAAWSSNPGGDRSEASMPNVMKDLIEANDRADALGVKLDAQAHDMAVTAAECTQAKEALAGAQQEAVAAEGAQKVAEEAAAGYMAERDIARTELAAATDKLGSVTADLETAQADAAKIPDLMVQLDAANQTIADLNGKVAELTADLKTATAPKAAKTPKVPDAPEAPAESPADAPEGEAAT